MSSQPKQFNTHSEAQPTATLVTPNPQSRVSHLHCQITKACKEIEETEAKLDRACNLLKGNNEHASAVDHAQTIAEQKVVVEKHIKLLTKYNDTKDVAMAFLGMIAENEGRRLVDVMESRGVEDHK